MALYWCFPALLHGNVADIPMFLRNAFIRVDSPFAMIFDELTPLKTNMNTQNDGLEKVTPLKHGNSWYLC